MDVGTYYECMVGVLISGPNKGELRGSRLFFQRGVNAAEDLEASLHANSMICNKRFW